MCPSWRVWREPVSRCSPGDFGARGCALQAGRKGQGVGATTGGRVPGEGLWAFARVASAPCRHFPALSPAGYNLWPNFQCFLGSGTAVFCKLPREGPGVCPCLAGKVPTSLQVCARAWKGWPARQCLWVQIQESQFEIPGPSLPLTDPTARPLQHPEMGGRKISEIAEGEERGKCWCPLSRSSCRGGVTHCQDLGLALLVLGGWVERGGALCLREYSPPRALMGCTLLPPIRWRVL